MEESKPVDIIKFEKLLGDIWLYVDWYYVTKNLTTTQKELFADAVDAASYRAAVEDGREDEYTPVAVRWWRDDYHQGSAERND